MVYPWTTSIMLIKPAHHLTYEQYRRRLLMHSELRDAVRYYLGDLPSQALPEIQAAHDLRFLLWRVCTEKPLVRYHPGGQQNVCDLLAARRSSVGELEQNQAAMRLPARIRDAANGRCQILTPDAAGGSQVADATPYRQPCSNDRLRLVYRWY
jgi:hypothetical protein